MRVFVTGGSGFVGRRLIQELRQQNHQVRALVRHRNTELPPDVETVIGDSTRFETLDGAAHNCDAIINLVGIIREFPGKNITFERLHTETTANLVRLAQESGIKRFIQMSANGTRKDAVTGYHRTKWAAEQHLRSAPLEWTIFRPSLIFGAEDQFINMLAGMIKTLPIVPVMGDGSYRLQPVSVEDIARSFVSSLDKAETAHQTYHCCGPLKLSYDQLLDEIGYALGRTRPVVKLHHPLRLMRPIVSILERLPVFPMTSDQLTMLLEENICESTEWSTAFNLQLTDLADGIRQYL